MLRLVHTVAIPAIDDGYDRDCGARSLGVVLRQRAVCMVRITHAAHTCNVQDTFKGLVKPSRESGPIEKTGTMPGRVGFSTLQAHGNDLRDRLATMETRDV